MERPDPWGHSQCPTSRSTSKIEALCVWKELIKRENLEVVSEKHVIFRIFEPFLVESGPFLAEPLDRFQIYVWR